MTHCTSHYAAIDMSADEQPYAHSSVTGAARKTSLDSIYSVDHCVNKVSEEMRRLHIKPQTNVTISTLPLAYLNEILPIRDVLRLMQSNRALRRGILQIPSLRVRIARHLSAMLCVTRPVHFNSIGVLLQRVSNGLTNYPAKKLVQYQTCIVRQVERYVHKRASYITSITGKRKPCHVGVDALRKMIHPYNHEERDECEIAHEPKRIRV